MLPLTFQLARSRIGQEVSVENRPGHKWVTGLGFDQLRTHIGSSFYGIPCKNVDGEKCIGWILNKHLTGTDDKIKSDALTFFLSFPLYVAMCSKETILDVSVQTPDGHIATTAILIDYPIKNRISRWWHFIRKTCIELYLTFKLWKQGSLPELVTHSKWKSQCNALEAAVRSGTAVIDNTHRTKGPHYHHWYVNYVATSPDHQNLGYGTEIMKKVCSLADEENIDCYLECSSQKNKKFYEKFGFKMLDKHTIDDTAIEESTMYFMLRRHHS